MDSWTKHCIEQMRKRQAENGLSDPPKNKTRAYSKKRVRSVATVSGGRVSPR